jgi:MFS family permease
MSLTNSGLPAKLSLPSRIPFYYGWIHVVLAALAMSATLPGRTYGLGLIKEPVRATLGIGDFQFDVLNFWGAVLGAVIALPTGWLIDRIGARLVLTWVSLALGASVILMSQSSSAAMLLVSLILVRGLGQGALSVVAILLVGKWFKRGIGPAMGVFSVLLAFGFVATILGAGGLIHQYGWRDSWAWIGASLILGMAPFGWLIARDSPEACGIQPDEAAASEEKHALPLMLRQAIRTQAFWAWSLAGCLFNFVFSALTLDNQSLLQEHGMNGKDVNDLVLAILMVSGLPANIVAGMLARRRPVGKLLAVGMAALAISLFFFPMVRGQGTAIGYALLLGVSGGIVTVVWFAMYGHTYGRMHLGGIQGIAQILSVLASATGPLALSGCREYFGSSIWFFIFFGALSVAFGVISWRVRPPTAIGKA